MLQSVTSKIKPEVSITDESFDSGHGHRYHLFLNIGDSDVAFVVLNNSNNKFILLKNYLFDKGEKMQILEELFSSNEYLSNVTYKKVSVSVAASKTTLVPAAYYDANDSRKFLELNHVLSSNDVIHNNYVRAFNLYNVFAVEEELNSLLKSTFTNFNLLHSATPFMEGVHLEYRNISSPGLFINFRKNSFELIATNGKQLLLYNRFNFETPEDLAYYLLFVAEQLRINPELSPLILFGDIQKESALFEMIYKYFRHVSFADLPDQYKYHYEFRKLSSHTYFSLFNQALCEL